MWTQVAVLGRTRAGAGLDTGQGLSQEIKEHVLNHEPTTVVLAAAAGATTQHLHIHTETQTHTNMQRFSFHEANLLPSFARAGILKELVGGAGELESNSDTVYLVHSRTTKTGGRKEKKGG